MVAFEPEYSNLYLLKENIHLNNLTAQIRVVSCGVSDFTGLSSLHIQDFQPGAAVHTESRAAITTTDDGFPVVWDEGIFCVTLDHMIAHSGVVPAGLKIDTDGNEDKILAGAQQLLRQPAFKSLVIEMPNDRIKRECCIKILLEAGFVLDWSSPKVQNQIWVRKGRG